MDSEKILTLQEYALLFQNIILAEYDNLFSNAELRRDLGLSDQQAVQLAVEYLCAATFLMSDLLQVSQHEPEITAKLESEVRGGVFRRILKESAAEGAGAQYVLYSLKRGMQFGQAFQRDDEGMKRLVELCLDQLSLDDPVSRLSQSLYLMNLLPAVLCLMGDLLRAAECCHEGDCIEFRIVSPEEWQSQEPDASHSDGDE